jgi:hypothetical protein
MKNSNWRSRFVAAQSFFEDGDYELALPCCNAAIAAMEKDEKNCLSGEVSKGGTVLYSVNNNINEVTKALVMDVHNEDGEPYYTIQYETQQGEVVEKQTTKDRLVAHTLAKEKQKILALIVECRLNIGGEENKTQAVEDVKQVSEMILKPLDCYFVPTLSLTPA